MSTERNHLAAPLIIRKTCSTMDPGSPVSVTTAVLEVPTQVWLGKAMCEEVDSTISSAARRPRTTSRRKWIQLGAMAMLVPLVSCIASFLTPRPNAVSIRVAPFVSADPNCQPNELSIPLQSFHLGAQVHFHLRNRACLQAERTHTPDATCRTDLTGPLQRFHVGAQVFCPHARLHRPATPYLFGASTTWRRSTACCASASASQHQSYDLPIDPRARGCGLQWVELASRATPCSMLFTSTRASASLSLEGPSGRFQGTLSASVSVGEACLPLPHVIHVRCTTRNAAVLQTRNMTLIVLYNGSHCVMFRECLGWWLFNPCIAYASSVACVLVRLLYRAT